MIEAKILEVTLNDEFHTGIRWDALKKNIYQTSFSTINSIIPDRRTSHLTSNLQNSDNELVSSGKIGGGKDFNLIMQALGEQGQVSVMSSPRVAALNNQRALIKSGEDQYFVTNVSNIQIDTGTTTSSTSQTTFNVEPLFSGISLDTTPNIISNEEILLHIHPMISRITKDSSEVTLNDKSTTVPVALVSVREVDTVVKSRSGDIIILGGMTNNSTKLSKSSLPMRPTKGFQKIFDLFAARDNFTKKSELIILMKPTIIENFSSMEKLGKFRDMSSDKSIEE
ncbi:MAG: hypothetical protein P8P83_05690 [Rickettsiaceae bacterium]|nr:hypothetical protein [Rickettsiaceae bacterium]